MDGISNVMVTPIFGYGNTKALASLNFKGVVLRGLKLIETDNSMWLGMPSKKRGENWEDICFFPDASVRQKVLEEILKQYRLQDPEPAMAN